ncbi:MAG: rhodanese-like domain-containing protein [Flavobacteriales bacterium]|nr:rhodanese-like domain-containing protein [Flavobacteriales bacterium]
MENKLIFGLILLLPLISCGQKNTSLDEEVKTLYRNTVPIAQMTDVENWKNAKVLDSREKEEYDVSHLPNAEFVGYNDFDLSSVKSIPKTDTIIVYCSVGYRSERIGEKLQDAGYKHVYNLYGGIFNWKNHDGVVVDDQNDTTQKVHTYNKDWSRFLTKGEKVY